MKTISIRDLHERTGSWVRQVGRYEEIRITDHGQVIAALRAIEEDRVRNPWSERRLRPGFSRARKRAGRGTPSERIIATMREG